jgi:LPS-assembly lipoprotein
MTTATRLLVIALVLTLAACGWRLRGEGGASLDGRSLAVELPAADGDLRSPVLRALRSAGAEVVDARERAEAVLVLLGETVQQRPVSVTPDARVQEYELAYSLRFRLETPDGEVLVPAEAVQVSDVYRYDGNNVLSTQSRAATVTERLRQDAVRLLLSRLQATLSNGG